MFERILGPKKKGNTNPPPDQRLRPVAFPAGAKCGAGCGKTKGYRCSYRDQTGARCGWWCSDHSVILNGRAWCQRHANSVKWLRARDGSIYEILNVAAIGDRSPNLAGILVDELNDEVIAHLKACFAQYRDVKVVTDGNIRSTVIPKGRVEQTATGPVVLSEGAHVAWARGWGVYSHVGYLARVVLRVTATEPPVVHLYVNGALALSRVPDWITNRGRGTDEGQDHATFKQAILEAIQKSVIVEHGDP
jgi:hypothetical protein